MSPQLVRLAGSIARSKPPPLSMPGPGEVDQPPPDGRRHGRPVRPHAALDGAVEVEQEEGHDIGDARLGHRALTPRLECGRRSVVLGCPLLRRVRVLGEFGDGRNLAVEVLFEGLLE